MSSPRFTSPLSARANGANSSPQSNLRSRRSLSGNLHIAGEFMTPSEGSPTFSGAESQSTTTIGSFASRSTFRNMVAVPYSPSGTPGRRRVNIRTDPSLVTCFDPADKELYDLWATKK